MERRGYRAFFLFYFFSFVYSLNDEENDLMTTSVDFLQPANLVLWPNGTIPFYINTDHFDNEQTLAIMSSLSLLAFRTCLRFSPAMVAPSAEDHVLTLANPSGARKCVLRTDSEPHVVNLGYDCLKAPWLDRMVLRALGLPFEHNRANRDSYIDVQYENIEQHAIPLYTKDFKMPAAIRGLPYDVDSVMHFGDRDFSKNGHRTIIFKDRETKQKREGMTESDIRKVEIIYGPECQNRDRMEKIELCHLYPGIPMVRRKRSAELETTRSLRVNPDITPPPEIDKMNLNISDELLENIRNLDIDDEVQNILDDVHRLTIKALQNARIKYCNDSNDLRRSQRDRNDVLGIVQVVANYAQSMVDHAVNNLTSFCEKSASVETYQRYNCNGCYTKYYSTSIGVPYRSTKHRPYLPQSTKHVGGHSRPPYVNQQFRAHDDNDTVVKDETSTSQAARKRRELDDTTPNVLKDNEHNVPTTAMGAGERLKRDAYYDRPRNRRRSRPVSDDSEDSDSDSSEDSDSDEERQERPQMKEDNRFAKDTIEAYSDEPKKGERKGKEQRKKPVNEDLYEERLDKETIERDDPQRDERQDKPTPKHPVRDDFVDDDSDDESSDEPESGEGDVKQKRKPPASKNMLKPRQEEQDEVDDDDDENDQNLVLRTLEMSKANKEFYKQRRWPHGVVYYFIDRKSAQFDVAMLRHRLALVNSILHKRTCASIEEISVSELNKVEDYLVLDSSPDYVTGRVGGRQSFGSIELLKGGQHRQHTAMMVMAMLGFYFELARHDRDEYVKVHTRHIRPDKLHHFEKLGEDATLPLPFDYKSATMPAWMFWRQIGQKGISTVATFKDRDPDGKLMRSFGQNKKLLSEGDIIKINTLYGTKCKEDAKKPKGKKSAKDKKIDMDEKIEKDNKSASKETKEDSGLLLRS